VGSGQWVADSGKKKPQMKGLVRSNLTGMQFMQNHDSD